MDLNTTISRERVFVECFFGRVLSLWSIVSSVYRWDHRHFDSDFENVCLLTNEQIKANQLEQLDYTFYTNICNMHYVEQVTREEKRKASFKKAQAVKKAKVRNTVAAINHDVETA